VLVKGGREGEPAEEKKDDGIREMAQRTLYVHHPCGHDEYRNQKRSHRQRQGFREPQYRDERQYRESLEGVLFRRD